MANYDLGDIAEYYGDCDMLRVGLETSGRNRYKFNLLLTGACLVYYRKEHTDLGVENAAHLWAHRQARNEKALAFQKGETIAKPFAISVIHTDEWTAVVCVSIGNRTPWPYKNKRKPKNWFTPPDIVPGVPPNWFEGG